MAQVIKMPNAVIAQQTVLPMRLAFPMPSLKKN